MKEQVNFESACLLHHRMVGEQDAVLTLFTQSHGKLSLWVKGALSAPERIPLFKPLLVSWRSTNGSNRLTQLEIDPSYPQLLSCQLNSTYLYSAFYVNEITHHFLPELAENTSLYKDYLWLIESLSKQVYVEPILRIYERQLLVSSGWLNDLSVDMISARPVVMDKQYLCVKHPHYGIGVVDSSAYNGAVAERQVSISGKSLLNFCANQLDNPETLSEVKRLMRWLIHFFMDGKKISSRSLFSSYKLSNR